MESFVVFLSDKKHEEGFTPLFVPLLCFLLTKKTQDLEISKVNLSMFRFHHENSTLALYKVLYYALTHSRNTVGKWLCSLSSRLSRYFLSSSSFRFSSARAK